jgi:WD40 repeat protein
LLQNASSKLRLSTRTGLNAAHLATAAWDTAVLVWDMAFGKALREIKGIASPLTNAIAWTPDATKLLLTVKDGSTQTLDLGVSSSAV